MLIKKSILMKNSQINQAQIMCRLVYHIISYFSLILYFVSSVGSNMSKFILLGLNCNNGNTYASYCYAVARRDRNFQYFRCCLILQELITANTVSTVFFLYVLPLQVFTTDFVCMR